MRGFDVTQGGVNRGTWLNSAVCACWTNCTILAGYGGFAYRGICLR